MKKIKVLMIGNHQSVKGGITSVIQQLLSFDWDSVGVEMKVCCAEHQKMKASKSIRLTRGIDASLEKPLSSKARKSFERFFQLWKKKKCKLRILIGCWT